MSDDPADIYITRDALPYGELRGRLVCAIFVNEPGFVEVTLHPADGGRFAESPEPSVPAAPPDGIAEKDAVETARDLVPNPDDWIVAGASAGPLRQIVPWWEDHGWARDLPADRWVWRVFLVSGDRGLHVVIDFVDGSTHGVVEAIVN